MYPNIDMGQSKVLVDILLGDYLKRREKMIIIYFLGIFSRMILKTSFKKLFFSTELEML
jgi:hypothetical protein